MPRGVKVQPQQQLELPIDEMTISQVCEEVDILLGEVQRVCDRLREIQSQLQVIGGDAVYRVQFLDTKTLPTSISLTLKL